MLHFTDEAQTKGNMVLNCPNASSDNEGVLNEDYNNGSFSHSTFYGTKRTTGFSIVSTDARYVYTFYGDVRNADGTEAKTDEEYIQEEVLDFSNTSDVDLDKLLNEILEALERNNPDFSNVEGLLKDIYFRLGTLDSDNDNALLNSINASIIALTQSNEAKSEELITKLDELKEALKKEDTTETDLTEITDELKKISGSLNGLLALEVVENILELTEAEQQLFDEYASLIPLLINKLGFALVQNTMTDIESVIFTSSAPSDLTVNMYDGEYVILSQSMFNVETMRYVNLAKTFISVILIYAWCASMRKKLAGGDS